MKEEKKIAIQWPPNTWQSEITSINCLSYLLNVFNGKICQYNKKKIWKIGFSVKLARAESASTIDRLA